MDKKFGGVTGFNDAISGFDGGNSSTGPTIKFVKVTIATTAPVSPSVNDLWIKDTDTGGKIIFDTDKAIPAVGDYFIRTYEKEQIAKASELKMSRYHAPVQPETPDLTEHGKFAYTMTDLFDVYARLGQVWKRTTTGEVMLAASRWTGAQWETISSVNVLFIVGVQNEGIQVRELIGGVPVRSDSTAHFSHIAVDPDRGKIFTTSNSTSGQIYCRDLQTFEHYWTASFSGDTGYNNKVIISSNGNVCAANIGGSAKWNMFNTNGGNVYSSSIFSNGIMSHAADGVRDIYFVVGNSSPSTISIRNSTGAALTTQSISNYVSDIAVDSQGNVVLVYNFGTGRIAKWSVVSNGSSYTLSQVFTGVGLAGSYSNVAIDENDVIYAYCYDLFKITKVSSAGTVLSDTDILPHFSWQPSKNQRDPKLYVTGEHVILKVSEAVSNGKMIVLIFNKNTMSLVSSYSYTGANPHTWGLATTIGDVRNFRNKF
ncbi:hypothetical protein D3P09_11740 [Paenibacillus pinisoli]|uniref:WD40 repeat domain-containing protein n=1 Tax=Paenibacillus pinisoli TaxID=1276110 RepID=A0A3A6PIA0_9BACL|nr:hypothetical protein [Paenibacillus pinisoli]RJX40040.1 hypothetical protein D3P09_11740 [Paenibacillus pinisoli]